MYAILKTSAMFTLTDLVIFLILMAGLAFLSWLLPPRKTDAPDTTDERDYDDHLYDNF